MRIRHFAMLALFVLSAPMLAAQAPWTVTIRQTANPLPIGTCHTVSLTVYDPATKGNARNASGGAVSAADFDMSVASDGNPAAVGKYEGTIWSACACQSATVGQRGTITATYPAKAIKETSLVPGVAFKSQAPFTFSAAESKYNPAGCAALAAAGAGAASGGASAAGTASGGAAGAAAGSATSGGVASAGVATGAVAAAGGVSAAAGASQAAAGAASGAGAGTVSGGAAGAASGGQAGAAAGGAAGGAAGTAGAASGATGGAAGAPSGAAGAGAASGGAAGAASGGAPVGPQNVRLLAGDSFVLAWDRVPGIAGYRLYVSTTGVNGEWTLLTGKSLLLAERFTDSTARRVGTMYRVTAIYADGREASTDFLYMGR